MLSVVGIQVLIYYLSIVFYFKKLFSKKKFSFLSMFGSCNATFEPQTRRQRHSPDLNHLIKKLGPKDQLISSVGFKLETIEF